MRACRPCLLIGILLSQAAGGAFAQVTISLGSVIGSPGANAVSVAGVGNAVNFTGVALDIAATTLIAAGSTGASSFNFNTGFTDTLDRTIGSTAGAPNVWADRKYDSATTGPLILDANSDGSFVGEPVLTGFGMHSDTFITFDLAVLRTNAGLAANTPLILTGSAGIANTSLSPTSGAIIYDSTQALVFDWSGPTATFTTFSYSLPGTARYLTFAGLSGLDANNFFAHVGYANVQLMAIPEPSVYLLLAAGAVPVVACLRRRRGRPAHEATDRTSGTRPILER